MLEIDNIIFLEKPVSFLLMKTVLQSWLEHFAILFINKMVLAKFFLLFLYRWRFAALLKRLQPRHFLENIATFLITTFLKNIHERLHLMIFSRTFSSSSAAVTCPIFIFQKRKITKKKLQTFRLYNLKSLIV